MSSDHSEDESEPNAGASDEERLVGQSPAEADADDDAAEAQDDPSDPDAEPPGDGEDPFRPRPGVDLAQTLLHESVPPATSTIKRRYAYRTWFQLVVSLFIAYHGTILLVHNLPGKGLAKGVQKKLNQEPKLWPWKDRQFGLHAGHYWRATGNTQSWAMFAPNPHRSNIFMRVMVKDKDGEVWDLKHDIYGKRTYPYLWYDRMGKINRRIVDQKGYRRHYAAWVCREWEKDHDGESAEEVQFVKLWTRIPPPQAVFKRANSIFEMGYDPMELELHEREEDSIRCRTTRHAQLPPYLRERYGLPEAPERHFKPLHIRTWYDQKESKQKQEEREAKRDARKARLDRRRRGAGGEK